MESSSTAIERLTHTYTKNYKAPLYNAGMYWSVASLQRPLFYRMYVPLMLRDPHIWYGMEILKGPIESKAKFLVESDDMEVADYVTRQIEQFWIRGINKALECLSYGYSASEVLYEYCNSTGMIEYKDLKFLSPRDVKAVTKNGEIVSVQVSKARKDDSSEIYLRAPKFLWTVYDKKINPWYGRSRLEGAFDTWWEVWQPKGYRGIRQMWYYRYAYQGGILYYPDGTTQDPETGEERPNALIAQECLDRAETGSSLALPQKTGENRDWEWESPKSNPPPEGLLEYGEELRDEMWEGIGVPPEVAKAEDSGGFAGRRVPQQAFYSYLQGIANEVAFDFDEQVIRHLVKLNFGPDIEYNIVPIPIIQTLQEEEMGLTTGETTPGEDPSMEGEMQLDEEGNPIEEEVDENGNPINSEGSNPNDPMGLQAKSGAMSGPPGSKSKGQPKNKIEDRSSNSFNMSEKAQKNQKKKKKR